MKAFVTGAGLVGTALVRRLHRDGHKVTVFDAAPPREKLNAHFVQGDLRDGPSVAAAIKGHEAIFHTAALHPAGLDVSRASAQDYFDVNVAGTYNVLEGAAEYIVRRVVHCSTIGVFGFDFDGQTRLLNDALIDANRVPASVYGLTKALNEHTLEYFHLRHGLDVVALRYGGIWELVRTAFPDTVFIWASGGLGVTTLADVIESQIAAMAKARPLPRLTYTVVAPRLLDLDELANEDDIRPAISRKYPDLSDLPEPIPRPLWVVDLTATEHDLGFTITGRCDALLREALCSGG